LEIDGGLDFAAQVLRRYGRRDRGGWGGKSGRGVVILFGVAIRRCAAVTGGSWIIVGACAIGATAIVALTAI
jgi:hypothetical protein